MCECSVIQIDGPSNLAGIFWSPSVMEMWFDGIPYFIPWFLGSCGGMCVTS